MEGRVMMGQVYSLEVGDTLFPSEIELTLGRKTASWRSPP